MNYCHFDNPDTMAHEVWEDGKLRLSICATLIDLKDSKFRPFRAGHFIGDKAAMLAKEAQP